MVSKEEWTQNRSEKVEAMISYHLADAPEGRLGVLVREFINFSGATPPEKRAARAFDYASFDTLINQVACAIATEDCARFGSVQPILEESEVIDAACEKVELALGRGAVEKKGRPR